MKTKNLLLIFVRNPKLGTVKTRLASTLGEKIALEIYVFLVKHTQKITKNLPVYKQVWYSDELPSQDDWKSGIFQKKLQQGTDLGARMQHAFSEGFREGYKNIIIIGSDMLDLTLSDLENAFRELETADVVFGPAQDGGYYLLGMKIMHPQLFENKSWGSNQVLSKSLADIKSQTIKLLEIRNDIDTFEDIKNNPNFQQFLIQK